jgi:acyl carrier protein
MNTTLVEELKVKLIDILNLSDLTPSDIDENAQLVGGEHGIDSIDVLEMVVMIEKDYGVKINNKEVGEKVFSTLSALARHIEENTSGASD